MTLTDTPLTTLLREPDTPIAALYAAISSLTSSDADVRSAILAAPLSGPRRAAVVASLWAAGRRALLKSLLADAPAFTEPNVLGRALTILDSPRRKRQVEAKLAALTQAGARASKLRKLRDELNALTAEAVPDHFSAARSFRAVVKRLLRDIPAEREEFDVLFFGPETGNQPWKGLADLLHTKPADFKAEGFQPYVFGEAAPTGSFLADAETLNADTLPTLLEKWPRLGECFSFIRQKLGHSFTAPCAAALVRAMPLADALWHYEELSASDWATVDAAIEQRLRSGDELAGGHRKAENFGKLMERLLTFRKLNKVGACAATWRRGFLLGEGEHRSRCAFWPLLMPVAEALLEELKAKRLEFVSAGDGVRSLQALAAEAVAESGAAEAVPEAVALSVPTDAGLRVAVLGDASSSMQTAIDSATIVGAMFSSIFEADLVFFSGHAFKSERHPTPATAEEVLAVTEEVRAGGTTSPAAALAHFAEKKQEVDLFIVVTDEEENTPAGGGWQRDCPTSEGGFAATFERYRRDVHPSSRVLFVSFLANETKGVMVEALKGRGIDAPQLRFDPRRPDLSKFNGMLDEVLRDAKAAVKARRDAGDAPGVSRTPSQHEVFSVSNAKEDRYIQKKLSSIPPSERVLRIGKDPAVIALAHNAASWAVRGLLYDAHSRFGAPSAAYELPRETSSAPFGCPATAERLRTLEAVVERTRALGVEVRCELEAHRDHASKASES